MNFLPLETLSGRQRFRQWSPLITQQFRLRNVYQILGLNFPSKTPTKYYFTLHSTSMSAPFYTSEKISSPNPKWSELDVRNWTINSSVTTIVLRVWRQNDNEMDEIIVTWGINLSGLVYLGNKITDIQPIYFHSNTVIFYMRGGYFTSQHQIRTADLQKLPQFYENLNMLGTNEERKMFRRTSIQAAPTDIRTSYNLDKLRKLHSTQLQIRNISKDVQILRDKINSKCGIINDQSDNNSCVVSSPATTSNTASNTNIRYAPQLLTMNSLNKLLQDKPTKVQRQEMIKLKKDIEMARFRTKLLAQERDKKASLIRQLQQKISDLLDENEERGCNLMDNYHKTSKDVEKLKEFNQNLGQHLDIYWTVNSQLQHRQRQLMHQLLFIYPIQSINETKYTINGIYLPNSDILPDCSDTGQSVALGYIAHILTMCSVFLQIPLRYPIKHYGSRSSIIDNINPALNDKEKEFPLFTKGKDKTQFTYAVFLLNKNIAQLRWLFFMHTPDLKATLSNLLTFLESYKDESKDVCINSIHGTTINGRVDDEKMKNSLLTLKLDSLNLFNWNTNQSTDPLFDSLRKENQLEQRSTSPIKRKSINKSSNNNNSSNECGGPGLSEILAIPEAFLNKQISSETFKSYANSHRIYGDDCRTRFSDIVIKNENNSAKICDSLINTTTNPVNIDEIVEQGTDTLDPNLNLLDLATVSNSIEIPNQTPGLENVKRCRHISRSIDENFEEICSEPSTVITTTNELSKSLDHQDRDKCLESWMNESRGAEGVKDTTVSRVNENPLTVRTDALLNTKSFNLVKPKH